MKHLVHLGKRRLVSESVGVAHPHIPPSTHSHIFPLYHPSSTDILLFWDIPALNRSGYMLVTGLLLGASHAPLRDVIYTVESAKAKRSMFAETQREREDILEAIKNSEWNMEMNPLVTSVRCEETVAHDFSTGWVPALTILIYLLTAFQSPCSIPVTFDFRNYSSTHDLRFILKLTPTDTDPYSGLLPPAFSGRLTRRGKLARSQHTSVIVKMWVTQPGAYSISGWQVETEVLESDIPPTLAAQQVKDLPESRSVSDVRVRHRYIEGPPPQFTSSATVVHRV